MFGSGNPMPYDISLICLLAALAMVTFAALLVRIAATVVVRVVTPTTNGIIGAGRVPYVVGGRRAGSL
jgi:hypothetical protein